MTEPVTLAQAEAMVAAWGAEFGFQLHAIARSLYMEVVRLRGEAALGRAEDVAVLPAVQQGRIEQLEAERDLLVAERDAERADYTAVEERLVGYNDALAADRAGLIAERGELQRKLTAANDKLIDCNDDLFQARADVDRTEQEAVAWFWRWQKLDSGRKRALAAIPCARAKPDGVGLDCACPDYRYAPCCNLRVALLPGGPVGVEQLGEGALHLFDWPDPANPRAPRYSAGVVKLVEPEP